MASVNAHNLKILVQYHMGHWIDDCDMVIDHVLLYHIHDDTMIGNYVIRSFHPSVKYS